MKRINVILIGLFVIFNSTAQNIFVKSDEEIRNKRKVELYDQLDSLLNSFIDQNEIMDKRAYSYEKVNTEWSSGKLYTKKNDTISGLIKILTIRTPYGTDRTIKIKFKENDAAKEIKYRADKIIGFEKSGIVYYSKRNNQFPPQYIEIIEKGSINLYYKKFHVSSVNVNTINTRESSFDKNTLTSKAPKAPDFNKTAVKIGGPTEEYYMEKQVDLDDIIYGPIPHGKNRFVESLSSYIEDFPKLLEKVKNKQYTYQHIREIIQIYNKYSLEK